MRDPRREAVLGLILEWDHTAATIHDHLGMTLEQWLGFRVFGDLPEDYEPRRPKEPKADPPSKRGRPTGRRVSESTKHVIRQMHARGVPGRQIARELHVSQNTVLVEIAKVRAIAAKEAS